MNLNQLLAKTGQYPSMSIKIVPLDVTKFPNSSLGYAINTFIEYRFKASVVQPVAEFSFSFANPSQNEPLTTYVSEGDIILLIINIQNQEFTLATGIIDTIETQVSPAGEVVSIQGRDLLGQWDDQGVFTPDGQGIWAASMSPSQLFNLLQKNTRTPSLQLHNFPDQAFVFGSLPMESKLQVLSRLIEPAQGLIWAAPNGNMIIGKPNMAQAALADIICSKSTGVNNTISIRSTRSAGTIPNFIVPILSGQTNVATQVSKQQGVANNAPGPSRLLSLGHRFTRVITISDPDGNAPQTLNAAQAITSYGGVLTRAKAYAYREFAKENMREIVVQAIVPGHMNPYLTPYAVDQVYNVTFDRDNIDEKMYLYELEYTLNETEGPRTSLMFTRMGTIVAGVSYQ